ncbi:hypothetical protein GCM10022423_27330 [Flavobacterium ginsengiterrae]|uniref:Lipoprotein n=1 Tax=Flavobacterium ginsengiterrae TaxID=871695 RepID=A0ABP7GSW9_9FLAO
MFCLLCSCTKTKKSEDINLNKNGEISDSQRIEKKRDYKVFIRFYRNADNGV